MRNLFLFLSIGSIGLISSIGSGLNRSALNQCLNNSDNNACEYLLTKGTKFQQVQAKKALLIRGL